jgi:hypothetical protein
MIFLAGAAVAGIADTGSKIVICLPPGSATPATVASLKNTRAAPARREEKRHLSRFQGVYFSEGLNKLKSVPNR